MKALFSILLLLGAWSVSAQDADPIASNKTPKTISTEFEESKNIALHKGNNAEDSFKYRIAEDSVFVAPQTLAQFPGGQEQLSKFFARNLTIPENLKEKKMTTKVFIRFLIQKSGQITNVHLVKGFNDDLNIEALRVVKMMPIWEPARQYNKPVISVQTLPVSFVVE